MDIFISHASEDKDEIAHPIANELRKRGFKVWYDEYILQLGDSLRKKIDEGLAQCRFGLVILSPNFFSKQWTQKELDALTAREVSKGTKVILPIWHNITAQDIEKYSPILAGRFAVSTSDGLEKIIKQIIAVLTEFTIQPTGLDIQSVNRPLKDENGLINWCISHILNDQFDTGDAAGAWSKKYPEYLKFLYGENGLPDDISIRDTITFSAWIAIALKHYTKIVSDNNTALLISSRLHLLKNYLERHYDEDFGGFGLMARPKSRTPISIEVDLRHTCWAMFILWELEFNDAHTDKMLKQAGSYVHARINSMIPEKERAITYAVLHKLLCTEGLSNTVFLPEGLRRKFKKRIETILVEKFDSFNGSWDLDFESAERASIDNALFILYTIPLSSCDDNHFIETLRCAVSYLCDLRLIQLNPTTSALPFFEKGKPDIGATLLLLYILIRDQAFLPGLQQHVNSLIEFVKTESTRLTDNKFAYPWQLAMALHLS